MILRVHWSSEELWLSKRRMLLFLSPVSHLVRDGSRFLNNLMLHSVSCSHLYCLFWFYQVYVDDRSRYMGFECVWKVYTHVPCTQWRVGVHCGIILYEAAWHNCWLLLAFFFFWTMTQCLVSQLWLYLGQGCWPVAWPIRSCFIGTGGFMSVSI